MSRYSSVEALLDERRGRRATCLVGLGESAARKHRDDLEHLLVEHDDAAGLLERVVQVVVEVVGVGPALSRLEERPHHVALHRTRPEQRDVGDDVGERLGCELADELALTG